MDEQIRVDRQRFPANSPPGSIRPDGFSLLVWLSGRASFFVNPLSFEIQAGEALLLRKEPEYHLTANQDCEFIRIDFSEEAFYQACLPVVKGCPMLSSFFIQSRGISMSYLLFTKCRDNISPAAERLLQEYHSHQSYYESILLCELMTLLLSLSRNSWEESVMTGAADDRLLQQMMEYLVNNLSTVTLRTMAEAFSYHPNTVSSILKKGTGKTFQQLLEQTRMSHVAELLGHMTVQEAAENCGYQNMSNFYVRFQNHYGMTPGEYAQRMHRTRNPEVKR